MNLDIKLSESDIIQALQDGSLLKSHSALTLGNEPLQLEIDSRSVSKKSFFIALTGQKMDGHAFIEDVIKAGCRFIIVEAIDEQKVLNHDGVTFVTVRNSRAAWSVLCASYYHNPQKDLRLVGVTGTNGKTSTAWFVYQMIRAEGFSCAYMGTIGNFLNDEGLETSHTTSDPPVLFSFLAECKAKNIPFVVMECSSHAIAQKKLFGLKFEALAFTSFSRDHLDFHKTMEEYWNTKLSLFVDHVFPDTRMVWSNSLGDKLAKVLRSVSGHHWVYGYESENFPPVELGYRTVKATSKSATLGQTHISLNFEKDDRLDIVLPLAGTFACENFMAAFLLSEKMLDKKISISSCLKLKSPPGRWERVSEPEDNIHVIVDYAHTPDALEKILKEVRKLLQGRLLLVFGCGGERDKGKRPLMAQKAESFSDLSIVTSDNPRTEDPFSIISDILKGFKHNDTVEVIEDRASAIERAIGLAMPGDAVVIAGKGHEDYQIVGTTKHYFDDRKTAAHYLSIRGLSTKND